MTTMFLLQQGQDSVIECVQYQNTVEAYQSYNIPGDNNKRLTTPVCHLSAKRVFRIYDGTMT